MLGQFQKSLKETIPEEEVLGGLISANLPERHSSRVWRNDERAGREFTIDA